MVHEIIDIINKDIMNVTIFNVKSKMEQDEMNPFCVTQINAINTSGNLKMVIVTGWAQNILKKMVKNLEVFYSFLTHKEKKRKKVLCL